MPQATEYEKKRRAKDGQLERHPFIEEMRTANMIPRSVCKDELGIRDIWFLNGFRAMFKKR